MKTYTNGQRPMKMYGGGMASPRPPMMSATEKQRDRQQSKNVEPAMGMPRMKGGGLAAGIKKIKMKNGGKTGGKFPDLNKDGEITQADILVGRGVKLDKST